MCSNLLALLGPETSALLFERKKKKNETLILAREATIRLLVTTLSMGNSSSLSFQPLTVTAASFSPSTWAMKPSQVPTQAHAISWHVHSDNNSLFKDVLRKSFCPPFRSLHWTANIARVFIFLSASLLKLPQKYGLQKQCEETKILLGLFSKFRNYTSLQCSRGFW